MNIIVRENGRFTDCLDSGEPVQYEAASNDRELWLHTLDRAQWVDDPVVMDVQTERYNVTWKPE